jgi:hypothetical protein
MIVLIVTIRHEIILQAIKFFLKKQIFTRNLTDYLTKELKIH